MTTRNEAAGGKKPYMAGCVFLGILSIIFALNFLIRLPLQKAVCINKSGISCLETPGKRWFVLEEGSYVVDGQFETRSIRSSSIPLVSKKHMYFNIEVVSGEESFVMPVRVSAKKADRLGRGESVALYGMVSELDTGLCEKRDQALGGQKTDVTPMCLNDNGDTIATRILSAGVFVLLTIICIWLAIKIYKVKT